MTSIARSLAGLLTAMTLLVTGCTSGTGTGGNESTGGSAGGDGSSPSQNITEEADMSSGNNSYTANGQNVKLIGRTAEEDGILWLAHSASGFEFTFTGTSASVTVVGDNMISQPDKRARFAAYVDGERVLDEQVDSEEKTYEIFSSDSEKETTIKLLKLSEAAESTMGIKSIDVVGGALSPTAEKSLKIEFIGDSITCGYGVDDEDRDHHFSTATEDATRAYAYKTAQLLDADYSLVSYSGHGIISGYTDNGTKVTSQTVPPIYEQFAKSYGSTFEFNAAYVDWDFSRFVPDVVVINLGTNDASYAAGDRDKVNEYSEAYVEFLKKVREHNPDAYILCVLGVMGADLFIGVRNAVDAYTEETGDTRVSALRLTAQNGSTGYAADWHPTEATHEIAANEVAEEIKTVLAQ